MMRYNDKLQYYNSFSSYLNKVFECKVHKIAIDAGFNCPNRDGKIGNEGCSYCDNKSFSPRSSDPQKSVSEQVKKGIDRIKRNVEKFIVYFQTYTNTYASVEHLKKLYDESLNHEGVVGLAIGTRPDCVDDDILKLIEGYTKDYHVWIEYGLQSSHDKTLERVNRGHGYKEFVDAVNSTTGRGINICAHVILGLPGEDRKDMIETARRISSLKINGVKIHHLYVSKNTPLEKEYKEGNVKVFEFDKFLDVLIDFMEELSPRITIQRLCGDVRDDLLVAPIWDVSKSEIIHRVNSEFKKRKSFQGKKFRGS